MALNLSLTATFNFSFEMDEEEDVIKYSVGSIDHSNLSLEEVTTLSDILKHVDNDKVADIIRVHLLSTIRQMEADEAEKNDEDATDTDTPKDESETNSDDG